MVHELDLRTSIKKKKKTPVFGCGWAHGSGKEAGTWASWGWDPGGPEQGGEWAGLACQVDFSVGLWQPSPQGAPSGFEGHAGGIALLPLFP